MTIPYLLGCLQLNKFFPEDSELFKMLIQSNNFSIKIAAIKALVFYPFTNKNDLESFLALLKDNNPNVSMELASSIKHLKLNNTLKFYLENFLANGIKNPIYSSSTRGELFLSYLKLFNPNFDFVKKNFENEIPKEYFYQACGFYNKSENALKYLSAKFANSNGKDKISILESALNFQKYIVKNEELNQLILNSLISNSPALISIAADGIDSLHILQNQDKLKSIIIKQAAIHREDPDYLESLMSLSNLAEKFDKKLSGEVLKIMSNSTEYSIKKFAYEQLGLSVRNLIKGDNYFNYFWADAFKYKYAEISTIKGTFEIELLPQYAPISVGNFCYLAKKNFFNKNTFHRVVPGFVIQGGDPEETGWGGPGYDIISEFSPLNYDVGTVGMASAGKDTEGSQWFVTTGTFPHLNGRYTIFAKTIKNINVVDNIAQGDSILKINFLP
jgi:cyclophilin family peptidyl-prolyl cis-trans isomerase